MVCFSSAFFGCSIHNRRIFIYESKAESVFVIQMRISILIFVIGIILLIGGVLLAVMAPATAAWTPKSETIATEKPLPTSAGWESKSESLIDQTIMVSSYETYDYWFGNKPFTFWEAKDFEITGTATEQSSPQRLFNFHVLDSTNFDLWKAGSPYTFYYETKGETSVTFDFSIAAENAVPDSFYFVIEENAPEAKPTVHAIATISWVEKTSVYDSSEYYTYYGAIVIEESKDFVLKGNASEASGKNFNFYIFDSANYWNWIDGAAYTSYVEERDVTSTSFSVSLEKEEATSMIYFVAEDPLVDKSETVQFSATLEWSEKETIAATIGGLVFGGIIASLGMVIALIAGIVALVSRPTVEAKPMRTCLGCGMQIPIDYAVCPYCGKKVEKPPSS